jgi:hypothetical protein
MLHVWEIPGSNLSPETYSKFFMANARKLNEAMTTYFTSFPVHNSLIIISFNIIIKQWKSTIK